MLISCAIRSSMISWSELQPELASFGPVVMAVHGLP